MFHQLKDLLQTVRIAREAGRIEDLGSVCDQIVALWLGHLGDQKIFVSNVRQEIDAVDRVIRGGAFSSRRSYS
jgi:hypothetical protein